MKRRYVTVRVRRELIERLDEIARALGYESGEEAVDDAVRRFIEMVDARRTDPG
ncbi:MAG: ribbon-helix-helix protein, CopG family [Nitrososphaerota archaeon]|nr:ribbon-helix-helix protein, CopG family [Nitrososphaerota archaeon]